MTLDEEFRRCYRNTDRFNREEKVDAIIVRFLEILTNSEFAKDTRSQVLKAATTNFWPYPL